MDPSWVRYPWAWRELLHLLFSVSMFLNPFNILGKRWAIVPAQKSRNVCSRSRRCDAPGECVLLLLFTEDSTGSCLNPQFIGFIPEKPKNPRNQTFIPFPETYPSSRESPSRTREGTYQRQNEEWNRAAFVPGLQDSLGEEGASAFVGL